MEKSFIETLREAKMDHKTATINYFNDGSSTTDTYSFAKQIDTLDKWKLNFENDYTLRIIRDAVSSYSTIYDFDSVEMHMLMGLIFNINDTENNKPTSNAEPLKNIVRYYTYNIDSYLNDEKTNDRDYNEYGISHQGYLDYDSFVKHVNKSGLVFKGPQSFVEFKNQILSNEMFDISVKANSLEFENNKKLIKKL